MGPAQRQLYEIALGQHGLVTAADARAIGVDGAVLRMLHHRGRLDRLSRGVYRFAEMPATELDQYAAATFWPHNVRGVLSHATAVERHGLCDVNPAQVHVTLPIGYRVNPNRAVPRHMRLHFEELDDADVTTLEGIPIVVPVRAIVEAASDGMRNELLRQAVATLRRRGLLTPADSRRISTALAGAAP